MHDGLFMKLYSHIIGKVNTCWQGETSRKGNLKRQLAHFGVQSGVEKRTCLKYRLRETPIRVLSNCENQEVVHAVLDEIFLLHQSIAGLFRFPDNHVLCDTVVLAIAVAIDHSYPRPGIQR